MLGKVRSRDYKGEDIVVGTRISRGKKEMDTVRYDIPYKPFDIEHAVVCGNGLSRKHFKFMELVHAGGGLLHAKKPEVYACNLAYKEKFKAHHLVVMNKDLLPEVFESGYSDPLYVPWHQWPAYKDKEPRLVPNKVNMCAGATALYLAAWHGHKTIYMLGFDLQPEEGKNNNIYAGTHPLYPDADVPVSDSGWIAECIAVMKAYPDVRFIRLVPSLWDDARKVNIPMNFNCPDEWADLDNFRQLDFDTFKSEMDLGPIKNNTPRGLVRYRTSGPRVS